VAPAGIISGKPVFAEGERPRSAERVGDLFSRYLTTPVRAAAGRHRNPFGFCGRYVVQHVM
jgi:hypothetical protein